jgi:hypothetical protein
MTPSYDYYSNTLTIDFPYAFSSSQSGVEFCPDQVSVKSKTFGLGGEQEDSNSIDIDVVQLALAFALNFGITETNFLSRKYSRTDSTGKTIITTNYWIHDSYPNMRPVSCITSPGKPRVCYGVIGSELTSVYPVFTSATERRIGPNTTYVACECPQDSQNSICNAGVGQPRVFEQVQIELLFATNPSDEPGPFLSSMQNLQQIMSDKSANGPNKVQHMVSELAFTAEWYAGYPYSYESWKIGGGYRDTMPYRQFTEKFRSLGVVEATQAPCPIGNLLKNSKVWASAVP